MSDIKQEWEATASKIGKIAFDYYGDGDHTRGSLITCGSLSLAAGFKNGEVVAFWENRCVLCHSPRDENGRTHFVNMSRSMQERYHPGKAWLSTLDEMAVVGNQIAEARESEKYLQREAANKAVADRFKPFEDLP